MKHLFLTFLALALLSGCVATDSRRSTGEVIDDSAIATRLKTRLLADRLTDGLDIEIEVHRRRVQLIGFADSEEERLRAGEIASGIPGVATVTNDLQVVEQSRRVGEYVDDKVLVTRVKAALTRDPAVKAFDIEVEVNASVVVLGGFVATSAEREQAQRVASEQRGVARVVNVIEVK